MRPDVVAFPTMAVAVASTHPPFSLRDVMTFGREEPHHHRSRCLFAVFFIFFNFFPPNPPLPRSSREKVFFVCDSKKALIFVIFFFFLCRSVFLVYQLVRAVLLLHGSDTHPGTVPRARTNACAGTNPGRSTVPVRTDAFVPQRSGRVRGERSGVFSRRSGRGVQPRGPGQATVRSGKA